MTPDSWDRRAAELFPYEVQDDGSPASKIWRAIYDTKRFEIAEALRAVESETLERAAKLCAAEREKGIRAKVHGAWVAACEDLHDAIAGLKSSTPRADEGES